MARKRKKQMQPMKTSVQAANCSLQPVRYGKRIRIGFAWKWRASRLHATGIQRLEQRKLPKEENTLPVIDSSIVPRTSPWPRAGIPQL